MKKILLPTIFAFAATIPASAQSVVQSVFYQDGDDGTSHLAASVGFTSNVTAGNIVVAGMYIDGSAGQATSTDAVFGGVSADSFFTDLRLYSWVFDDVAGGSLTFDFTNTGSGGIAIVLYEVSSADFASLTTVTATNAITTSVADELILSFAGRNNSVAPTISGSSIFSTQDYPTSPNVTIWGGGSNASASASAPSIGSQNISWNNASEGRIAYAFEAGNVIPETSSAALLGVAGLSLLIRRRRS